MKTQEIRIWINIVSIDDKHIHRQTFMNYREGCQLPMSLCSYPAGLGSTLVLHFACYHRKSNKCICLCPLWIWARSKQSLVWPCCSVCVCCVCVSAVFTQQGGGLFFFSFLLSLLHGLTLYWDGELIIHSVCVCVCVFGASRLPMASGWGW